MMFRKIKCLFLGMAALLAGSGCESLIDLTPQEKPDITIFQLQKKMSQAMDPMGRYKNAKSYIMKQDVTLVIDGTKEYYTQTVYFKAPDKMCTVCVKDGVPITSVICHGKNLWSCDLRSGKYTKIPEGLPSEIVRYFTKMATPGLDPVKIFKKVSFDMKTENGYKTYRIICDPQYKGIAPYVIYVNGQTFLQEKMETICYAPDGEEYIYRSRPISYEWFSGVKLPLLSEVQTYNQTTSSIMKEFILNPEIPESQFLPKQPFTHKRKQKKTVKKPVKQIIEKIKNAVKKDSSSKDAKVKK